MTARVRRRTIRKLVIEYLEQIAERAQDDVRSYELSYRSLIILYILCIYLFVIYFFSWDIR